VDTIDETESRYEKESISSRTGRDQIQSTTIPPTTADPSSTNVKYLSSNITIIRIRF
jgi:hypothetical protein